MFVRTKDKIIKVDETGYIKEVDVCGKKCLFLFNKNYLYGREVLKQADTIEELCDCFIGEFVNEEKVILEKWNGNKFVIRWATKMIFMIKDLNKTYANIKGAIWTDTGLIYVAKMNEKGELELI